MTSMVNEVTFIVWAEALEGVDDKALHQTLRECEDVVKRNGFPTHRSKSPQFEFIGGRLATPRRNQIRSV